MRSHARRERETGGTSDPRLPRPFARIVGFAFTQCWLVALCVGKAVCNASRPLVSLVSPTAMPMCAGLALASFAVLFLTVRVVPLSRRRAACVVAAVAASAGTLLATLASHGLLPGWLLAPGSVLAGVGMGVQVLAWQEYFSTFGVRRAIPGMAVTSALGAVLFFVLELLPSFAAACATCALPLAGELTRWPRTGTRFYAQSSGAITERRLLSNMLHDYSPRLYILCGLVALAFSCGCASAVPGTAFTAGPGGALIICLVGLGMCVACASVVTSSPQTTMRFFYVALPLLMVHALAKGFDLPVAGELALLAGAAGVALAYCLVWALMVGIAQAKRLPALGLIAFLHASCFAGAALGQVLAHVLPNPAVQAPLVMLAALGAAALLFAGFNGRVAVTEEMYGEPPATRQEQAVLALAERFGLTPRETEVLQVWSAGHNAAYMEQTLHITRNTVKTHLNHIYQKTGTSGREELLALLASEEGVSAR